MLNFTGVKIPVCIHMPARCAGYRTGPYFDTRMLIQRNHFYHFCLLNANVYFCEDLYINNFSLKFLNQYERDPLKPTNPQLHPLTGRGAPCPDSLRLLVVAQSVAIVPPGSPDLHQYSTWDGRTRSELWVPIVHKFGTKSSRNTNNAQLLMEKSCTSLHKVCSMYKQEEYV